MKSLIVKIKYLNWAIKRSKNPRLGDTVTYNGQPHALIQGVQAPYWDLMSTSEENLNKPIRDIERRVHQDDFQLDKSIRRTLWAIGQGYRFQMDNWFSIDVQKPIFTLIGYIQHG